MFELSPHIDKNKIFLVNLSEIEGRLDPIMLLYQRKTKNYKYDLIPIRNLLVNNPQYGANEAGIDRLSENEPRYIRITDIDDYGNLIDELGKTARRIDKQYFLNNNDIIIARSGNTVGKAYIHKTERINYPCFFAGYMIRFKFNSEIINPDYAFIITQLSFYKEWLNAIRRLAGQPNINAEEYKSFKIPLPPKEIQQQIIDLYETAYQAKQQKETKAEQLLDSVDDYLLGKLGITLPEKDNSLENRIFKVNFSEVADKRWDAFYYQTHFKENINNIKNGNYQLLTLKSILKDNLIKGKLPNNDEKNGENKVVQISSIDNYGNIDLENLLTAKNIFSEEQKLKINDVIIVITGATIGKIAFWNYNGTYYLGGDLVKFQTREEINPYYIFYLLQTKPYQIEIERNVTGATNGHLAPNDIEHFPIPIPSLEKQNEIAEHIKEIKEQAKQLKSEAKEVLEQAKQEVEKMILGE